MGQHGGGVRDQWDPNGSQGEDVPSQNKADLGRLRWVVAYPDGPGETENPDDERRLDAKRPDGVIRILGEGVDVAKGPGFVDLEEDSKDACQEQVVGGHPMDALNARCFQSPSPRAPTARLKSPLRQAGRRAKPLDRPSDDAPA